MAIPKARSIDIVVAVVAVAFFLARQFDLVGPVARWTGLAVFVLYLGWFLRRRSPYRRNKPGDLHLNG